MEKQHQCSILFDSATIELFENIDKISKQYQIKRVNGIILLKALLDEKDSIFYECLCATSVQNPPYKQIMLDCDEALKEIAQKEEKINKKEIKFSLSIQEKTISLYFSNDFNEVMQNTYRMIFEEEREGESLPEEITVYTEDIFASFISDTPEDALKILKNNGVSFDAMQEYYAILQEIYSASEAEAADEEGQERLPYAISDFATILTTKYKGMTECEILGREKECKKIMRILQKRGKKNVILIGEPGVGKTAIAERIAFDIATGNCPEDLKNHIVIQVDVNSTIAGTKYRGMAEERFKILVDYLNTHDNIIVFIDEIHMVIGAGATSGNDSGNMSNALKPFLASPKAKVIGATTEKEFEQLFSKDEAFKRRFERITVKEPKSKEIYNMLKNSILAHEKFHDVKIEKNMVEYAVLISGCFNNNTHNPDRTNDLIDAAMVIAKEQGKEYVDRDCILENFDINFEKFKQLEESEKLSTSYHEAGHYLVWRKSGKLKDLKATAVSIMPAEGYLGVTVYDDLSDEVTVYPDRSYYIDYLAKGIAGRVAEEIYTHTISAGAESDLEKVNKLAYDLVTQCGMSKKGNNRVYFEDEKYHMLSENIRNAIDEEVSEIVKEATERAKEIISQNENLLLKIVDALLKKSILDENDLEEICKE